MGTYNNNPLALFFLKSEYSYAIFTLLQTGIQPRHQFLFYIFISIVKRKHKRKFLKYAILHHLQSIFCVSPQCRCKHFLYFQCRCIWMTTDEKSLRLKTTCSSFTPGSFYECLLGSLRSPAGAKRAKYFCLNMMTIIYNKFIP